MVYVPGPDNTVADALSRLPEDPVVLDLLPFEVWSAPVGAVLSVATDESVLNLIKSGYKTNEYCIKVANSNMPGTKSVNSLWYIGDRLLIPRIRDIRKNLFHLAHNSLGHFGSDKLYATLCDAYFWPNMRRDPEKAYIPSCQDCQRNKSRTTKAPGPLHPLPVPDGRGSSVAMDFVGTLRPDNGFDLILTITDHLGADIRIIPTQTDINAEDLAVLFFDHWFFKNGLPTEIMSDRDKLFISRFWKALTALCGVKLKMSSSYHLESDGSSERTNKTINQSLQYYVERSQRGWVRALPRIHFNMMNTVNASMGFSNFQLHLGRSPRLIPPLVPTELPEDLRSAASKAEEMISQIQTDVLEAQDNLLQAKIFQEHYANMNRGKEFVFVVGDMVMLSTFNRRREYNKKGDKQAAKFFPHWDGPYKVVATHVANNATLFPTCEHSRPGPILTPNGLKEHEIDQVIDSRAHSHGYQYLVRWKGYGPEDDEWLPGCLLEDCKVLDRWLESGGDGPGSAQYLLIQV
jgi:hypothetical protein